MSEVIVLPRGFAFRLIRGALFRPFTSLLLHGKDAWICRTFRRSYHETEFLLYDVFSGRVGLLADGAGD
jgi:hypothetical protein